MQNVFPLKLDEACVTSLHLHQSRGFPMHQYVYIVYRGWQLCIVRQMP